MQKIVLVLAVAALATSASAQTIRSAASPSTAIVPPGTDASRQQVATQVQRMAQELGLSAVQQTKVQQILLVMRQDMDGAREAAHTSGSSEDLRTGMKAARTKADDQLRATLTPAQFARYQQLAAQRISQLHTTAH